MLTASIFKYRRDDHRINNQICECRCVVLVTVGQESYGKRIFATIFFFLNCF